MKQKYSVLIVSAIVVVLYSLIVFLVPFYRGGVFWLSYIFTLVALVSQLVFLQVAFGGGTSARSRVYGFPIFRVGMVYLGAQLVLSLVFMILGKFIPVWLPTLCYLILLGLGAIGLIASDNVRDSVRLVEEKQAENTAYMRSLRRSADVQAKSYPELAKFAEALRYADPVSTTASEGYERRMGEMLLDVTTCPDGESRQALADQLMELLGQRNSVCKSSKTR